MEVSPVVTATIWRIRESRRKEARQRDKDMIWKLKQYVSWMEMELAEWRGWYSSIQQQQQQQRHRQQRHHRPHHWAWQEADSMGLNTTGGAKTSVIDYSKWAHIGSSDEEEEEEEEAEEEEYYDEFAMQEASDDEYDLSQYGDGTDETRAVEKEEEEDDDENEEEADETKVQEEPRLPEEEEEDDAEDDGGEEEEEEGQVPFRGFTDNGDINKVLLSGHLDRANRAIQRSLMAATKQLDLREPACMRLDEMGRQCATQVATFQGMIDQMDSKQFTSNGSAQVLHLISDWQRGLCGNLQEL